MTNKWLLGWCAFLIASALIVEQLALAQRLSVIVGLVEVLAAMATGVMFGVAATRTRRSKSITG